MTTRLLPLLLLIALPLAGCGRADQDAPTPRGTTPDTPAVSGRLEDGLRVLTFDPARSGEKFTIYRGDYVKPELVGGAPFTLEIPDLGVTMSVPVPEGERPYVKVPDAGVYAFRIGDLTGEIEALEYLHARYREVSAKDAAALIANISPLVLDVRTGGEYAGGHLPEAQLIPVQELSRRLGELAAHKREPVLIYCATGNRSTVAAKMLIDAGFEQVVNVRRGIAEWSREGLPVVK